MRFIRLSLTKDNPELHHRLMQVGLSFYEEIQGNSISSGDFVQGNDNDFDNATVPGW